MKQASIRSIQASNADTCSTRSVEAGVRTAYGSLATPLPPLITDEPFGLIPFRRDRSASNTPKIRLELARARYMLVRLDSEEALVSLQRVERQIALTAGQDMLALYSEVAAMRAASLVLRDDVSAALAAALSALRLDSISPTAHVARTVCRYVYLHLGDMKRLDALTCGERIEYPDRLRAATAVFDCSVDAMIELRKLHLNSAQELAEHALNMAQYIGDASPSIDVLPASIIGQVLFERGRLEDAHALIAPRLPHLRRVGMVEGVLRCYCLLARIAAARGQSAHAQAVLADAEELAIKRNWPRLGVASLAQQVAIHLWMGSPVEATGCARRLEDQIAACARQGGMPGFEMARYLAITHARLALARPNGTFDVQQLHSVYLDCLSRHDYISAVEVALLLVEAQLQQQRQDEAFELLAALLRYAVSAGLLQTLVDCKDSVGELISKLGRGDMPSRLTDAHSLRAYANLIDARRRARRVSQPCAGVVVTANARRGLSSTTSLSERERMIVWLMGQGMTNKQIALHLRIAPETVKSYAKHLYTKLSVKNRAEAVTVAARHGLALLPEKGAAASVARGRIGGT
ncbi:LuxR C-terminal-related transcriptional regulator [Paraburkholderia tropica]|uniref:Regulatory LuxR family protein n=1 Tax=Paraburkholderia tropica TaxID=92647 RepID=A0ABX5MET3_9BURK|nr:LuxR C-terminal-related transcriptional regulator [Paraburkholderia tropica]PXX06204.1 regulatory LuxR family protein [Paraburkholderia tropica]PZW71993.1 regulatory LuxR family protein [Paraburkholderia tropica]